MLLVLGYESQILKKGDLSACLVAFTACQTLLGYFVPRLDIFF